MEHVPAHESIIGAKPSGRSEPVQSIVDSDPKVTIGQFGQVHAGTTPDIENALRVEFPQHPTEFRTDIDAVPPPANPSNLLPALPNALMQSIHLPSLNPGMGQCQNRTAVRSPLAEAKIKMTWPHLKRHLQMLWMKVVCPLA